MNLQPVGDEGEEIVRNNLLFHYLLTGDRHHLGGGYKRTPKPKPQLIFQNQPEPPPIPKEIQPVINTGPPPPPPPPPIPLKFYGFTGNKSGPKQVFLSKGDDIFIAKEGQIIDRRYKIIKIGPNSVEVEDVLTNNRQTLPLTAG